ncbi:hypothetical protein NA57DRAFT_56769 [Rhizodiscina lignyota]|uniref:NAD(P)-binding protein n=1 Tax=Rhizodiscina lignyota TaxID=1504668 RepID=A0A9P4M6D8_9PEZI|nr:hypothetical protein NA57DRAFT_56769 [Rhizodiscina lignyota]
MYPFQPLGILFFSLRGGCCYMLSQVAGHDSSTVSAANVDASDLVAALNNQGLNVQFIHCDASDWESQVNAFISALNFAPTKTLDVVAVFAGIDDSGHLVDYIHATKASLSGPPPAAPSVKPLEVNSKGAFYTAALALHYFRLQPQGSSATSADTRQSKALIIVSSLAGYIDDTHDSVYTASKFGSRGVFRAIRARAQQELNVRVNLIAPWAMKAPMTAPILAKLSEYGIEEGKGISFVEHDVLTQAVAKIAVDESISGSGRAFAVVPEGAIDIDDDLAGGYGGPKLQELMALRKKAGDFLTG